MNRLLENNSDKQNNTKKEQKRLLEYQDIYRINILGKMKFDILECNRRKKFKKHFIFNQTSNTLTTLMIYSVANEYKLVDPF